MRLNDIVNARLLARHEAVLWLGVYLENVGMNVFVTPAQVKVQYMEATVKLHPNKVCLTFF